MALPALIDIFQTPACFTLEEATQALDKPRSTVLDQVKYLMKQGYIYSVRRGLYALNPDRTGRSPDPYVIAGKVTEPYVFAYHSALELHGVAQAAIYNEIHLATPHRFSPFSYEGTRVTRVRTSQDLIELGATQIKRQGTNLQVASRELALVQCADRPKHAGGLEEVLLSLGGFPFLQWGVLEEILSMIDKKILYRKAGFILTYHSDRWDPPNELLEKIANKGQGQPSYFGTNPELGGTLVPTWDLIVPDRFALEGEDG